MKDITEALNNKGYARLRAEECECILRIMVECGFVEEIKKYNNPNVTKYCKMAIKSMEACAQMEGPSILDEK